MNRVVPVPAEAGAVDLSASNISGRLERLPMTSYQRGIFAIIASAWLVDQVDVALLTFLLGAIVAHLSPHARRGRSTRGDDLLRVNWSAT